LARSKKGGRLRQSESGKSGAKEMRRLSIASNNDGFGATHNFGPSAGSSDKYLNPARPLDGFFVDTTF
jgi:phage gpG-like protein